jgi:hypothetical protein
MSSDRPRRRWALILAAALLAVGCGHAAPPRPPLREVPPPAKDLAVRQRGTVALLSVSYPRTTAAGKALNGVSAVEVWEFPRPLPAGTTTPPAPLDPRLFAGQAKRQLRLASVKELAAVTQGDRIEIDLDLPKAPPNPPVADFFAVKMAGPKGDMSPLSNQAVLLPKAPPPPPLKVTVTPQADGILIAWEAAPAPPEPAPAAAPPTPAAPAGKTAPPVPAAKPTTPGAAAAPSTPPSSSPATATTPATPPADPGSAVGFYVYRRNAQERRFGFQPLFVARRRQLSYLDRSAVFGQSYIYSVTSVDSRDPQVESAISTEQELKYVDRYPPPVPTDLVAVAESSTRVRLVWKASEAPDLAGYHVYRQSREGGWKRLTEAPATSPSYVDNGAAAGQSYEYRVTAIDQAGNESAPGPLTRVVTPPS